MNIQLIPTSNGMTVNLGYYNFSFILENKRPGFCLENYLTNGDFTLVLERNIGIEYEIFTVIKDFIAKVFGRFILDDEKDRTKYPKDFISIDGNNKIIRLKGYDARGESAVLSFTYNDKEKQIRINAQPSKFDNNYFFSTFNKEYYGKCLIDYGQMIERLNRVHFRHNKYISYRKNKPQKSQNLQVEVCSVKNGGLVNGAALTNPRQTIKIVEDNGGAIHFVSPNESFVVNNSACDDNEKIVYELCEEVMQLIFGHVALTNKDELRNIDNYINLKAKKLNLGNMSLIYRKGNIIIDFRNGKKNYDDIYHTIIEMNGARCAGASYILKDLLYKLIANFEVKDLTKQKGMNLGRRR